MKLKKFFHYKFIIPKTLFHTLKIKTFYIEAIDDNIVCYGNKKLYNQLLEYEVLYTDQYKLFINNVFLKRIVIIISFIITCMIFFSSSFFIREIKFKDSSMYDYRIYSFVQERLNKKYGLYTLKEDINTLSLSLRAAFPNYAYLGISKQGSSLIVEVEKIDIKNNKNIIKSTKSIISNYNAVIYGISCRDGVVLVNLNQSIKKGDTLVVPNYEGAYCDAVILGKFSEYVTISVKKRKLSYDFSGRFIKKIGFKVGKNYLNKFDHYYKDQDIKIINRISLFNYFYIVNLYYYEKDYLILEYDYDTAYNYAVSSFYANLELYRKSNLEKINEINLLNYIENEEEYVFEFLINRIKSIGIYNYN